MVIMVITVIMVIMVTVVIVDFMAGMHPKFMKGGVGWVWGVKLFSGIAYSKKIA
jgi:hypothetical protein